MNDIQSLFFYIISLLSSGILYFLYNKKNKKIFLFLSFIIPVIISGIRYNVGTDYNIYISMYNKGSEKDLGFIIIAFISKFLGGQNAVFVIYSLLTQFFIYLKLKNSPKEKRGYIYFYYLFLLYPSSLNIMRQSLAMSIIFYAEKYIETDDSKKWIAFTLLATCFHIPAIIVLPFFYLLKIKNKYIKYSVFLLMAIISINIPEILTSIQNSMNINIGYFEAYTKPYQKTINNKMFYLNIAFLIYTLIVKKISKEKNEDTKNMQLYAFLYYLAFSFGSFRSPYIGRLGGYLETSKVELLANGPISIKNAKLKKYITIANCVFAITFFITSTFILKQGDIIPYDTIFGK